LKLFYDLHIHSCLSPCSDDDMTPNNIVHMALLKELGVIAVSDHNTAGNVAAVMAVGAREGLLVVPAMELCTSEEIHLLCLLPTLAAALELEAAAWEGLALPPNRPDVFGFQWRMDEYDEVAGSDKRMLIAASALDVETALHLVARLGGVAVPAHIDRDAYSMTAVLGTIPTEYGCRSVELSARALPGAVLAAHPETAGVALLVNSDAHHLWDMAEPEHAVELAEPTASALIAAIRSGTGFERMPP